MNGTDETMARIVAAIEQGRAGDTGGARDELGRLWAGIGPGGDPLHRCTIAHYLADLQDDDRDELAWDERALDAAAGLTPPRRSGVSTGPHRTEAGGRRHVSRERAASARCAAGADLADSDRDAAGWAPQAGR